MPRTEFGLQVRLPQFKFWLLSNSSSQEHSMSAPSRRPEIRRRRTRKEKVSQLRKRLAAAKTDADRTRLTAKLHKLAIASPGQPLLK
jgi:hypothetical protein